LLLMTIICSIIIGGNILFRHRWERFKKDVELVPLGSCEMVWRVQWDVSCWTYRN